MTCDRCFDGRHARCRKNGCTCTVCKELFGGVSRSTEPVEPPANPDRKAMGPGPKTDGQKRKDARDAQRLRYATDPKYRAKRQQASRDYHENKRKDADA